MAGKSEYPRVGSHRKVDAAAIDTDCEMCGGRILKSWGYWLVDIETEKFKDATAIAVLCNPCWQENDLDGVLEWWLEDNGIPGEQGD